MPNRLLPGAASLLHYLLQVHVNFTKMDLLYSTAGPTSSWKQIPLFDVCTMQSSLPSSARTSFLVRDGRRTCKSINRSLAPLSRFFHRLWTDHSTQLNSTHGCDCDSRDHQSPRVVAASGTLLRLGHGVQQSTILSRLCPCASC